MVMGESPTPGPHPAPARIATTSTTIEGDSAVRSGGTPARTSDPQCPLPWVETTKPNSPTIGGTRTANLAAGKLARVSTRGKGRAKATSDRKHATRAGPEKQYALVVARLRDHLKRSKNPRPATQAPSLSSGTGA
jgi:hypothetical protein